MEKPFVFIEYKTTSRNEFEVTSGRQPTNALFFLKKGSFKLTIDGAERIVKDGDCVILSDDIDFFRTVIDPISFIYLKFKINPKCHFKVDIPFGIVSFENNSRFLDSIEKYESLAESQDPSVIYYREHLLEDILLQAFAEHKGSALADIHSGNSEFQIDSCKDEIARTALRYIISNISKKISVSTLCRIAETNPSTLNFKIRKAFSLSTAELIEQVRMNEARRLLRNSTYKISEVASRCGFENIYYFSSVFKKYHGIAPTEYRRNFR